jgi:hypothetical protein
MNSYQAQIMAAQAQVFRQGYGTSVTTGGQTFTVLTQEIADRKAGADVFSHIGLTAYDAAPDCRIFDFTASDLEGTGTPIPGQSITWEAKVYTTIFTALAVVADLPFALRVFAYYAGPIVSVAVTRESASGKSGTGYTEAGAAIEGSPFACRVYRLRAVGGTDFQPPEGVTTVEKLRVAAFLNPPPPTLMLGDVCTLPDGTSGPILRLRSYPDRLDADIETAAGNAV